MTTLDEAIDNTVQTVPVRELDREGTYFVHVRAATQRSPEVQEALDELKKAVAQIRMNLARA